MVELEGLVGQVRDLSLSAARFTKVDSFSVMEKEGESYNIVTSADVAVQDFLQSGLTALIPGSGFQGEENGQGTSDAGICWIVDPIDGTANFARGMKQSGISIGLRAGGELVLGVVYNPDLDDMFWATRGGGAYLNGKRIHVSGKDFEHSIICTALCLYRKNYTDLCAEILKEMHTRCADFRRFGAASLELCYLAAGRVDLFFELRLYPWDFSAAAVILREAGGAIGTMRWDNGEVKLSDKLILDAASPVLAANCCDNLHKMGEIIRLHMDTFSVSEYN